MKLFLLLTLTTLMTNNAFARQDGVMVDENGLTIKLNQPVVVDTNRWDFNQDTYINKADPSIRIAVKADAKGNTTAVEISGLEHEDGVYLDRLYMDKSIANLLIVTDKACDKIAHKEILKKLKECSKLDDEIMTIFADQYADEDVITAITGVYSVSKKQLKEELDTSAKAAQSKHKNTDPNDPTIASGIRDIFKDKCSSIKRYSTKKEVVSTETKGKKKATTTK